MKMDISLPEEIRAYVEDQVAAGGYSSVGDYVHALIRRDMADEAREIDDALAAALDAGEGSGWSDKSVAEIVAEERAKFRSA